VTHQQRMGEQSCHSTWPDGKVLRPNDGLKNKPEHIV